MLTATKTTRIQSEDSPMPAARPRTAWAIDPAHSFVEFGVKHMMLATVRGRFTGISGLIELDEVDPTGSTVSVEIDAGSLDTQDGQRDAHLRSPDFLDVDRYPTITFKSTAIKGTKEHFQVTGDLTIRDITKPITLDVEFGGEGKDPWGGTRASFSAHGKFDRRDYGLTWNVALETGGILVSNEVKINIEAQVVLQA